MDELLQKYIKGEVSDEERQEVMRWLDSDPAHLREFMAMRKLYDISLWNTIPGKKGERATRLIRQVALEVLKVAAILIVALLISRRLHTPKATSEIAMQTIHVPAGQRAELTLADDTQVWLNSRSTLRFPERFDDTNREVELDGEGYFDVHHDESRPFRIHTHKYDISVLGTEFNVRAYKDSPLFETALIEGSVEISAPGTPDKLRLRPNETAIAETNGLRKSRISDSNYFKWKEGLFCFENESIQSLIKKLELYYDIRIEVRRKELLRHHYSGKFRIQDGIEHVLRVLQLKHTFSYTKDDEKNLITIQ